MKKFIFLALGIYCFIFHASQAYAQWEGCPNQGTDIVGKVGWRIRDVTTNAIILSAPQPNTVYKLEIFETPYNPGAPNYRYYQTTGIRGQADGFKLYSSVSAAQTSPSTYFSDAAISSGVAKDVGASSGVSTWGIKTLPASDPNWTGQLTAFKAFGACISSHVPAQIRHHLKTLAILP